MKLNKAALNKKFETTIDGLDLEYQFTQLDGIMEANHFIAKCRIQASSPKGEALWHHDWNRHTGNDEIHDPEQILPATEDDRLVLVGLIVSDYLKQTGADQGAIDTFFDLGLSLEKGQLIEEQEDDAA